jgi:hypothetical protein
MVVNFTQVFPLINTGCRAPFEGKYGAWDNLQVVRLIVKMGEFCLFPGENLLMQSVLVSIGATKLLVGFRFVDAIALHYPQSFLKRLGCF